VEGKVKVEEKTKKLINESKKNINIVESFTQSRSKPTSVYDLNNKFIKEFKSAKDITREYKIDYRTIRQHLKSGKPINKLKIIIKYKI